VQHWRRLEPCLIAEGSAIDAHRLALGRISRDITLVDSCLPRNLHKMHFTSTSLEGRRRLRPSKQAAFNLWDLRQHQSQPGKDREAD
jgi:hypothetical protein